MNWKQEAITQLQKYEAMVEAVETIPTELARLKLLSRRTPGSGSDGVRVLTSRSMGDDALINNIMKRQELEMSYKNAKLWVASTQKALSVLEPEEKQILEKMYIRPEKGAVGSLCVSLGIEQSSVYRRRDSALERFTIALYGAA